MASTPGLVAAGRSKKLGSEGISRFTEIFPGEDWASWSPVVLKVKWTESIWRDRWLFTRLLPAPPSRICIWPGAHGRHLQRHLPGSGITLQHDQPGSPGTVQHHRALPDLVFSCPRFLTARAADAVCGLGAAQTARWDLGF